MKRIIHWFRRDLRLSDNTALAAAVEAGERVIPVFILEDALRTGPDVGGARLGFLLHAVRELDEALQERGHRLVVRRGRSEEELPKLCRELNVEAVFCNRRYEPYARARDNRVCAALNEMGVGFQSFKDAVMWEELEVLTKAGNPFTVFTPYAKAWKGKGRGKGKEMGDGRWKMGGAEIGGRRSEVGDRKSERGGRREEAVPEDPGVFGHPVGHAIPAAGERAARETLRRFLGGPVLEYGTTRDYPAADGTSHLSVHLRAGTVGIRTVLRELAAVRAKASPAEQKSCDVFLNELIWREFYVQVLTNFPHVMKGSFRPQYDGLEWSQNAEHLAAWRAGQTGYPIVDAAMRCLNATGWMHNRLRMITAMFLTKDLLISWQEGERYFMRRLVDGDMAANNGGWQWSAGTGTDAAPYFRIFNPTAQGQRFDPEGAFIGAWVPELEAVPGQARHEPWKLPEATRRALRYPARIVLHEEQRGKCLAMYGKVRSGRPGGSGRREAV